MPGTLLHYDHEHARAVTSVLVRTTIQATSAQCYERFAYAEFTYPSGIWAGDAVGTCTGFTQRPHLVRLVSGGAALEDTSARRARPPFVVEPRRRRVVAVLSHGHSGWYFYGPAFDCFACGYGYGYGGNADPSEVLVLGGLDSGNFQIGRLTVDDGSNPRWGFYGAPPVYASGTKALVCSQTSTKLLSRSSASSHWREMPSR